jgi:tRNA (cmo5U34)-methyltransferase
MNEFDLKASQWDLNPMHRDRSVAIIKEMLNLIPLNKEMTALEYGAGTGMASFLLKDTLKEITLMDSSSEMVKITAEKIASGGAKNMKVLNFDLENTEYRNGKFDLIFNQMVMHHVNDVDALIGKFSDLLNPGGFLAIADLKEEDGSFHGEGFTGHRGFNIDNFKSMIEKHHFTDITNTTCFIIDRKFSDTETKQFEVFLVIARKELY